MATAIVIPVWNLWERFTLPCLQSLARHTDIADIHVYLVDNASTDATPDDAEKQGKLLFGQNFSYIKNSQNLGFAIACNQGAKQARQDGHNYVLFLNNDTVLTENWLPPLLKAMENPRVGMAGPLLLYPDGTVQHCGVVFTPLKKVKHIYENFPSDHCAVHKKRKFRVITGAVLLCRTEQFFAFGGFCEEYKNGMEDIDLCCSFVEHGFMQQVVPESIVYHYTSQTPGRLDPEMGAHNARLLHARKKDIVFDAHLYYAQDGYVPALTADNFFYARLKEEKRREFNKTVLADYSDGLCLEYLKKEPFWHDGYQFVIDSYIKQNRAAEAVPFCQRALAVCFSRHNMEKYVYTASLLGDEKMYAEIKQNAEAQLAELDRRKTVNQNILRETVGNTEWYQKLLDTRVLDTDDFGIY